MREFFDWQSVDGYRRIKVVAFLILLAVTAVAIKRQKPDLSLTLDSQSVVLHQSLRLTGEASPNAVLSVYLLSSASDTGHFLARVQATESGSYAVTVQPDQVGSQIIEVRDDKGHRSSQAMLTVHTVQTLSDSPQ